MALDGRFGDGHRHRHRHLARTPCAEGCAPPSRGSECCGARRYRMISFDMLVLLLLAAGLVFFIGEPLLGYRRRQHQGETQPQTQALERLNLQKEGLYTAIQDLDFDYQTGKVDQRDYET